MKLLTNNAKTIDALSRINIRDSFDLVETLPYRYDDYSYSDEENLEDGQKLTLLIRLVSTPKYIKTPKIDILRFYFVSLKSNKFYDGVIYNRLFYKTFLNLQDNFTLQGVYNAQKREISVIKLFKGEVKTEENLRPVYHLPSDLSNKTFLNLMKNTLSEIKGIYKFDVPLFFREKYKLLTRFEALEKIHFPKSYDDLKKALRTLKYNECLEFSLRNILIKQENSKAVLGKGKISDLKKINDLIKDLPYKLTHDQINAIREIGLDMNQDKIMYRLLQGDVGTGKTIVAIASLYANYLRHRIGVFMVPTDSLAQQQYEDVKTLLEPYGIKVGLLVGSLSAKEKNAIKTGLLNNEYDVLVGTHALFSKDVEYPSLGLCIIDEQHRFGVNQRSELISKGALCDVLLMSATPIPRTLSIALYGDLDVSTLKEYPVVKSPVATRVVSSKDPLIFQTINDALEENRQVFIVAPKISDQDYEFSIDNLSTYFEELYPGETITLTGRMSSKDKEERLKEFKSLKKKILISTTVIELGLNVLNAGVMIVYGASHFGLATLHQLRGRVGRDGSYSVCLLVDETETERLKFLEATSDGEEVAIQDLKLRGSGDFLGAKQSGFSSFKCVNVIDDAKMFALAKEDASTIIKDLNVNKSFEAYYLKVKERKAKEEEETILLIES